MMLLTRREREALRESFRPKRIRILFVGEAPLRVRPFLLFR